jgi:isochorismate synthase
VNRFGAARSIELDPPQISRALWLGARRGVVYATPQDLFVGLGSLHLLELGALATIGASELSEALKDLAGHGHRTRLRAYVAAPFQPHEPLWAVVPSVQLVAQGSTGLLTAFGVDEATARTELHTMLEQIGGALVPADEASQVLELDEASTGAEYAALVDRALARMPTLSVDKVVLARTLRITLDHPLDPAAVLERMREREPSCTLYAAPLPGGDRVVGASPELLISKRATLVTSRPLAGTLTLDGERDPVALRDSIKDLEEHRFVVDDIALRLGSLLGSVSVPDQPSLITLRSVAHLETEIVGEVPTGAPSTDALGLLAAIHPTPAIAGVPREAAVSLLAELEPADRGFFGGAFGWLDESGDGAFVLGIRGLWLHGDEVVLTAGAGIVNGSTGEGERQETLAKLRSVLDAAVPGTNGLLGA